MNVAFIPVRGGSKSIPLKNIQPICGKPLVYWTVKAACGCRYIDKVYVATDSPEIRDTVNGFRGGDEAGLFSKLEVIGRSAESASDTASTESAMLEFAEVREFDNIVLVQATSPLLEAADLDRGFEIFAMEGTDSVLSVVKQKRFNWACDGQGYARPTNYDVYHRPRRQEFDGYLVENGAFYICRRADLLRTRNRVSGKIRAAEMDEDSFFEIDEPSDWLIIEALMKKRGLGGTKGTVPSVPRIRMVLTDCDGCLTDGGMYYSENGDELKKFNTKDGMGLSRLKKAGIVTGIITGENRELNRRRAEKLKLDILVPGCTDKLGAIRKICGERGIDIAEVCYIGDDLYDAEAIRAVGFGCAPADARPEAREAARYVTEAKGGEGVIREIAEMILREENQ